MPGDYTDRFLEVLNSTFLACDENETGFVEINRLIDFLISQEPSWLDNDTIREEFRKVLHGDLNYMISKEDFIRSLQGWSEASLYQDKDVENEENVNSEAGKCSSSSTSGIGKSVTSEITSGSSTNSVEEIYSGQNFVTDEQTFTNEDLFDETSFNDSGSSQAESRLVKVLQSENSTLLRKNEYLENLKDSLLAQVSTLEDTLAKKKNESENYKNQLIKTNNSLELQTQKHEETEYRINLVTEENKSLSIQLSQFEREITKLRTTISRLEEKLESSVSEKIEAITKQEEITNKFNKFKDLYNNSINQLEQEREHFKFKETERENAWREVITENRNLQLQLDSNTSYTEDIKCKLRAALKELSDLQSARIKHVIEADNSCSPDNSMVFFDKSFSLDRTIPFESSLLAELKDEVESGERECYLCKQTISLDPRSSQAVDAAVGTYTIETVDKTTMTTFYKLEKCNFCSNVEHKDVGVDCSFKKIIQVSEDTNSSTFCLLESKRSIKKWASLFGVIFILSLLLVFFLFFILLSPIVRRSHKPMFYISSFFDFILHVQVKTSDIYSPIK